MIVFIDLRKIKIPDFFKKSESYILFIDIVLAVLIYCL
jgi:hypothetical protein